MKRFRGIAIGAKNGAGRDTATKMIQSYVGASGTRIVRCRAIEPQEQRHVVSTWLWENLRPDHKDDPIFIVPDMRFEDENRSLYKLLDFFCLQIHARDEIRMARILARDGNLDAYLPNDPSENEVLRLKYHEVISNESSIDDLELQIATILVRNDFLYMKGLF